MGWVHALKKDKYGQSSIKNDNDEYTYNASLQEPHIDFILNNNQYFNEDIVKEWVDNLKKYFPNTGYQYHFIM